MSGRPEVLFPLFADLENLPGIGAKSAAALRKAEIEVPRDLLYLLPQNVVDRRARETLLDFTPPGVATVPVRIGRHHPPRKPGGPYRIDVTDAGTAFTIVHFRANAAHLARTFPVGATRLVSGKVEMFDGMLQMVHPDHVLDPAEGGDLLPFEPVYPLTQGITQRQMGRAVHGALDLAPSLGEWIDPAMRTRRDWPAWRDALAIAHAPEGQGDLSPETPARTRLAYDEFFAHQVTLSLARSVSRAGPGRATKGTGVLRDTVLAGLPYTPTGAQVRAVEEITGDMASDRRMNRLLQGDVGSGKTLVALLAMLAAVEAGGQAAMMAPTEVLARQHLAALKKLAPDLRIEALTGRDRGGERRAKLDALAAGEIGILLGTHSIFQADVTFHDLRLAVIDEQHRFGVSERMELGGKGKGTDILVMTATPIPRSLSLTIWGDMDISVLDEKPPGRTPVTTAIVSSDRIDGVVARLKQAVETEGRQAYWVCPLVAESEARSGAAEVRHAALSRVFPAGTVGLVHGQMPPEARDTAMADFSAGRTRVLVATTVIEVGVDVPNASIMVIEGAEQFGLAQLHQLRGRVGRGAEASSCLLMYSGHLGEAARQRLEIMRETEDGFRIAEVDLEMRGAGDLIGTMQSGLPRFRVADARAQRALMEAAHDDARLLIERDPALETDRGRAVRALLWLLGQDRAFRFISVG